MGGSAVRTGSAQTRSSAVVVGLLFVVATGFFVAGQGIYTPILGSPDALELAYPERGRIFAGILVELIGVLAIPLIAWALYPVLRAHDETSALAYIGLRTLEAVALLVVDFNSWALVSISGGYMGAGGGAGSEWEVAASALGAVSEAAFLVSVSVIFPLGALVLNSVLWRARLVPRLISGWGFVGGVILLCGSALELFEVLPAVPAAGLEAALAGPIAVQEMALALWLIAKGFTDPAG